MNDAGLKTRLVALHVLKALGFFYLARRLTSRGLRIVCFHGMSLADEHVFHGKLFMQPSTFSRRVAALKRYRFPVVTLDEAVRRLAAGQCRGAMTVITFDDGWSGVDSAALPLLRQSGLPATIYIATEAVVDGVPVFNIAIERLFATAALTRFDLSSIDARFSGTFDLTDPVEREAAADTVIGHVKRKVPRDQAAAWIERVGGALGVDTAGLWEQALYRLMTPGQIAEAVRGPAPPVDVELHTHSHFPPLDDAVAFRKDLQDNSRYLGDWTGKRPRHLCYPAGRYTPAWFPHMQALGIESATTCDPGFNYRNTNVYELRRYLDGENLTQIEFEAEMFGVLELLRQVRGGVRRLKGLLSGRGAQAKPAAVSS